MRSSSFIIRKLYAAGAMLLLMGALWQGAGVFAAYGGVYTWDVSGGGGFTAGSGIWGTDSYWSVTGTPLIAWPGFGNAAVFAGGSDAGPWTITLNGTINVDSISFNNSGYTISGGTGLTFWQDELGGGTTGGYAPGTAFATAYSSGATDWYDWDPTNTWFTGTAADGNYFGWDLGAGKSEIISQIYFAPRTGYESRMNGGKVQGSNGTQTTGYVDLYTFGTPATGYTMVTLNSTTRYRWLRYLSPNGSYGNVAEMHFLGIGKLNVASGKTATIASVILQVGVDGRGILKDGAGTLVLTGANTYAGLTFVNAGTLQIGAGGTAGAISNSSNVVDNGTLTFNRSDAYAYSGVISGTGALSQNGSNTLTLTGANSYTGTTTISTGTLKIQDVSFTTAPRTYSISSGAILEIAGNTTAASGTTTINGTGTLHVTGLFKNESPNSPFGAGRAIAMSLGSGGLIDVETGATMCNGGWQNIDWTANLASLNVDGTFDVWDGNPVIVDALTGGGTITKGDAGTAIVLSVGVNNGSGTFSGVINNTNAVALTKTGSGTQTLSGANTYTGATTLAQGTLKIGANNTLPSATVVTIGQSGASTATLDLSGHSQTIAGLTVATGNTGGAAAIKVTDSGAAATLTINISSNYTFDSLITNTTNGLGIKKQGTGTLKLTHANTNTGADTVSAGILSITNTSGLGTGTMYVNGGTLQVLNNGAGSNGSITVSNALILNTAYTGTIDVENNGANTGNTVVFPSLNHGNTTMNYTGANSYRVKITAYTAGGGSAGTALVNPTTANLTIGTLTSTGFAHTVQLDGTGASDSITGVASDGTGALSINKANTSTWILSGANTYTGATTVSQGTLKLAIANALPSATVVTMGQSGAYTATLDLNGYGTTIAGIDGATGNTGGANAFTVTSAGAATLTINNSGSNEYDSLISGAITLVKNGSGTQTLGNIDNTFTGTITINAGTLSVSTLAAGGSPSGIGQSPAAATNLVIDGGTLKYTGGAVSCDRLFTIGSTNNSATIDASGSAALKLTNTGTIARAGVAARTLTLTGSCTGWDSLAALISDNTGATSLVKSGAGTWVLSAANTYTGTTTISNGGLYVTNAITVVAGGTGNGGAVTVGNGGTLGGTGEVRGAVTLNSGATLNPGTTGIGSLKIVGDLAFNSGSAINITLNGTSNDTVFDTGAVSLGNVTLNLTLGGFTPTIGQVFKIIDNDGTDGITGTFNGLVEGAKFSSGGYTFQVTYAGGTGNDVVLTVVPTGIDDYSTWLYSKPVYLNTTTGGANVVTTQDSFPVLVRLSSTTFNFSQARDSGQDIRFSKPDGTHMPYQIDSWSKTNKTATIWVRPDSVQGRNSTQYFVMYWGNSGAGDSSSGSGVFTTGKSFKGVWHLSESGSSFSDATSNGYTGTGGLVSGTTSPTQATGYIGMAQSFNGTLNYIDLPKLGSSSQATVSCWFNCTNVAGSQQALVSSGLWAAGHVHFKPNASNLYADANSGSGTALTPVSNSTWYFAAYTITTSGNVILFKNGVPADTMTASSTNWNGDSLMIGHEFNDFTSGTRYFTGIIDEACVSTTVRTPDWIKLCYENQKTNQTLVDLDDYTQWQYSRNINLNTTPAGADVDTNLANFPVLVRLTSSNFTFSQAQDSGKDIRFSKSNGAHIPFEIERWDRGNQLAEIWVKADTVYGNNGSQYFTMYWGSSSASSKSNSVGVFDSAYGFVGVYHFNNNSVNDATINALNGTDNGTANLSAGDIGNARDFNGSAYIAMPSTNFGNAFTISMWMKPYSTVPTTPNNIITLAANKASGATTTNGFAYFVNTYTTSNGELLFENGNGSAGTQMVSPAGEVTYTSPTWNYLATTVNRTAGTGKQYLNATDVTNTAPVNTTFGNTGAWRLGEFTGSTLYPLYGYLDEVVVSSAIRTTKWLKLCYQNQQADQVLVDLEDYSTWGFSKNITINTGSLGLSGNVPRFPFLVRLDNTNFNFNQPQVNGEDIRFSRADGTHFPYEIERWDKANTLAEIWVRIDTVYSGNSTQYFKMYWGKNDVTSKSSGPSVFETGNGFVGVYHLNESGVGTRYNSAQQNVYDGTTVNYDGNEKKGGAIATGDSLETNDGIKLGNITITSALTLSAWVRPHAWANWGKIISKQWSTNSGPYQTYNLQMNNAAPANASVQVTIGGVSKTATSASTLTQYAWNYVTGTYDNANVTFYFNGSSNGTPLGATGAISSTSTLTTIGYNDTAAAERFNGIIDEVRIENVARLPDWIKLCYNNQIPASTISPSDSSDAFRPLSIKRFNGGADSIYVYNTRWGIKFNAIKGGGGIKFLGPDTVIANNQLDTGLFCVLYKGHESDTGAGALSMLDSSQVFTRIRQVKNINGQPFTIDYTVLGSGKVYARVTTFGTATTATAAGLEFRIKNATTAHYKNIQYGATPSGCQAVMRVDSNATTPAATKYDILMVPFDLWSQADQVNKGAKYIGIGSTSWSLGVMSRQTWNFMIDISHKSLHDSAAAWKYINDYSISDTLGWFTGTPLLEKSWEDFLTGHWKLDEQGGTTAGDASAAAGGLGNYGNIHGTARWTSGMWGNGDSLYQDTIFVPHSFASSFHGNTGKGFTILGWVKPTATLSASSVLFQQMSGNYGYQLTGKSGGQLQFTVGNGSALTTLQGVTPLSNGQWYHVGAEMTYGLDTLKLYVNGNLDTVLVSSPALAGYPASYATDSVVMGMGFSGVLDDMRFYGEYLSDQQVKAIFLKGFSPDLGMYSVRADNNNQIQCTMHGDYNSRILPVFQIANYWAGNNGPTKVYVDTMPLGTNDYYASVDQARKIATVGLNWSVTSNSTVYIGNNTIGQSMLDTMPRMYWGQATVVSPHVWVKNFPGNYFGSSTAGNFFIDWKMTYGNATTTKNGEPWFFLSSTTTPNVRLDTVALLGSNLIPDYDGFNQSLNTLTLKPNNVTAMSTKTVTSSYTYSIAESSSVRVLLKINTRTVKVTNDSITLDTRWAIYPTGQIFVWDSLNRKSNALATGIYFGFMLDSLWGGTPTVTIPTPKSKLRAGISSSTIPDYIMAVTGFKNSGGIQAQPFGGGAASDTIGAVTTNTDRVGAEFCNGSTSPDAMWGAMPVQVTAYLDFQRDGISGNNSYIDSIGVSVQHFPNPALTVTTGSLVQNSWGDINGDGFSEGEGAYIVAASANTAKFTVLTHVGSNDTCRYNPAFRITGYTGATEPQYVMVGGVLMTPNYGYNVYLNKLTQEVVLQLNQKICGNTEVYISYDKTLAVTMDRFNAMPGDRNDTLVWRTESEDQNLGFYLYRRVKPAFLDSLLAKGMAKDADTTDNAIYCLRKKLVTQDDTGWRLVNINGLVSGAPQGKSYGPRGYRFVDYRVYNDIRYEYSLEAVDFKNAKSLYKDHAEVMPMRILPKVFDLGANFPNPFRSMTMIRFALPVKTKVDLYVYNIEGRLVRKLLDHERRDEGFYKIGWDGKDDHSRTVASGPYIYRMSTPSFVKARLMILAR